MCSVQTFVTVGFEPTPLLVVDSVERPSAVFSPSVTGHFVLFQMAT